MPPFSWHASLGNWKCHRRRRVAWIPTGFASLFSNETATCKGLMETHKKKISSCPEFLNPTVFMAHTKPVSCLTQSHSASALYSLGDSIAGREDLKQVWFGRRPQRFITIIPFGFWFVFTFLVITVQEKLRLQWEMQVSSQGPPLKSCRWIRPGQNNLFFPTHCNGFVIILWTDDIWLQLIAWTA